MADLPLAPTLESAKQAVDQGHMQGLFAFLHFLPPETFEDLLRSTAELWERNGCDPRFVKMGTAAARAAYRGETSWAAQVNSLSLDDRS